MIRKRLPFAVSLALASVVVLFAFDAAAGPSGAELDDMFSVFAFEARATAGVTPSFTSAGLVGGDSHVLVEGEAFSLSFGGRFASDLNAREMATCDGGFRWFPNDEAVNALFVGGGAFYGGEYVHGYKLQIGNLAGVYGEVGYETPRNKDVRGIASVRLDLGGAQKRDISNVQPSPYLAAASFNLGILYGGKHTRAKER